MFLCGSLSALCMSVGIRAISRCVLYILCFPLWDGLFCQEADSPYSATRSSNWIYHGKLHNETRDLVFPHRDANVEYTLHGTMDEIGSPPRELGSHQGE